MNSLLIFFIVFCYLFFICNCSFHIKEPLVLHFKNSSRDSRGRLLLNFLSSNLEEAFLFALCF